MIHLVERVRSDLATATNSCASRTLVFPSFFFGESLACNPDLFCVPEVLAGCWPSEPPPSAQQFLIVCPIFLHFRLVQHGQFLPFLPFWDCFEPDDLSGVLPCLASSAADEFWPALCFSSLRICLIRVLLAS